MGLGLNETGKSESVERLKPCLAFHELDDNKKNVE